MIKPAELYQKGVGRFPLATTFASIFKARLVGILILCAVTAVVLVGALVAGLTLGAAHWIRLQTPWLDTAVHWLVGCIAGVGGWFMLPALTVLVAVFFQDTAIKKVEAAYYPQAVRPVALPFWPELWHDLNFTLRALLLNVLLLPLYVFGVGFVLSIALNSYLVGREFFEAAAGCHMPKKEAGRLIREHRTAVYGGGLCITLFSLVPVLNVFIPILASVYMVHVYHAVTAPDRPRAGAALRQPLNDAG